MTATRLRVTDHAIVRYLERVLHLDIEKICDDIRQHAENGTHKGIPPKGGGYAIVGPNGKAACVVQNEAIVTVLGAKQIARADWLQPQETRQ